MATRERRLDIVIRYMEQHPGVLGDVQTRLRSLAGSYGYLRRNIGQLNLTQEELALRTGTQKSNISRLESGNYNPSVDFLNKIAKGLGKEIHFELK